MTLQANPRWFRELRHIAEQALDAEQQHHANQTAALRDALSLCERDIYRETVTMLQFDPSSPDE